MVQCGICLALVFYGDIMKTQNQMTCKKGVINREAQLAFRLMKASFEHEYYVSYADECSDPYLKDDLLNKIENLISDYSSTRTEFEKANPEALAACEASIRQQKKVYFANQLLN